MSRICLDARFILSGGIGTYLKNVLWHLQEGPFQLQLLVPERIKKELSWLKSFESITFDAPPFSWKEQLDFFRRIPPCDLFWSPHINVPLSAIRAKKRIVTIHDAYHLAHPKSLTWLERTASRIYYTKAFNSSDAIVTVSRFSFEELQRFFSKQAGKIKVIYHGSEHLKAVSSTDSEKFLLYVGAIRPHKNLAHLLLAWEILRAKYAMNVKLKIIGQRKGFRRQERCEIPEEVEVLEHISDDQLSSYYQGAAALVLPSLYEGFGLTALEAMSLGCPVIVSKRCSLPEICEDAAFYFNPLNPDNMAEVIAEVLSSSSLREQAIEKGRVRSSFFSWKKSAEEHLKLFEETLR